MIVVPQLKKLANNFFDLLFPITCLVCNKDGAFLCSDCQSKLITEKIPQKCISCQKPSPFGKTHPECVSRNKVDGNICALNYNDPKIKKIIETFKYSFVSDLAKPLTEMIMKEIQKEGLADYFTEFMIVPVPLHKRRFAWRGFNQAELLAKNLSDNLNAKIDTAMVQRTKFTKPQVNLNAEERKTNVENAFVGTNINHGKILLVDDVITSGSTVNELARVFKKTGASEVWAIATARG